jgi:hypothetical protein
MMLNDNHLWFVWRTIQVKKHFVSKLVNEYAVSYQNHFH